MALATDVISDTRLREAIGSVGDEDDVLLSGFRASAIDWLERYTGRCILDRNDYRTDPTQFRRRAHWQHDFIGFRVTDIKAGSLTVHYAAADADPQGQPDLSTTIATTDLRVHLFQDGVTILAASDAAWASVMRFDYPVPALVANRGMAAGDIPPAWESACALLVRALYDGSAYDDLGTSTALQLLMRPYSVPVYGRTARR